MLTVHQQYINNTSTMMQSTHKTQMTQDEFELYREGFEKHNELINMMFRQLTIQKRRSYVDMLIARIENPFPDMVEISELPKLRMSRLVDDGKSYVMCKVEIESVLKQYGNGNEDSRSVYAWIRNFTPKPWDYRAEIIGENTKPLSTRSKFYRDFKLRKLSAYAHKFTRAVKAMKLKPPLGVKVMLADRWREQILKHLRRFLYKIVEL